MSDIIRYHMTWGKDEDGSIYVSPWPSALSGDWVKYEDYERLKAEVERLRKAGDALVDAMDRNGCHDNGDYDENVRVTNEWNAAKEGKQP